MKGTSNGFGDLRKILDRKRAELADALRRRDSLASEKSPDPSDEIQYAFDRDLAIRHLSRDSNLLREVRAALLRMDEGAFGACVQCEEAINPKRLAAVPWAPLCIECQQDADRNEIGLPDEEFLVDLDD